MVGRSHVTVENFHVEAGKVEEFARAVHDDNPVHRSEATAHAAGNPTIPAPLTFTRTDRFPRYCPPHLKDSPRRGFGLGFDRERTVHGEQEYEFDRPVYVGDTLTGTTTLTDVFQKEGSRGGLMTFAVLETEYRDKAGNRVLVARQTRIELAGESDERRERNDGGESDG